MTTYQDVEGADGDEHLLPVSQLRVPPDVHLLSPMSCLKKKRDRKTERQRDRKTERQRDRETERQRDRETERQRDRKTEIHVTVVTLQALSYDVHERPSTSR